MTLTRLATAFAAACLALAAGNADADDHPVVVELYTSQGCSSCPPADALLGELADREDVIALALHVDYWDYLGWRDEFASPDHTKRQKLYARAAGERMIYTPQMIIGGRDHVVGFKPMRVAQLIQDHQDAARVVDLSLDRDADGTVVISMTAREAISGDFVVQLLRYREEATVAIKRGENRGRTLVYHNIAEGLMVVGEWDGQGTHTVSAGTGGELPLVAIVQHAEHGPIVAAARLK